MSDFKVVSITDRTEVKDSSLEEAKKSALEVLESLISKVKDGTVVTVICVGLAEDNTAYRWISSNHNVLEVLGSVEALKQTLLKDELHV